MSWLRTSLYSLCLTSVAITIGCGQPRLNHAQLDSQAKENLTIPATETAKRTLAQFKALAVAGNVTAAWHRAHYLLDLFDHVRLRPDDTGSRELLFKALEVRGPHQGDDATRKVIMALQSQVDLVLQQQRLHTSAQFLRSLLEYDANATKGWQLARSQLAAMAAVKPNNPLAINANLRRYQHCLIALRDAAGVRADKRIGYFAHCLYAVHDGTPKPFFSRAPKQRPPMPPLQPTLDRLQSLLTPLREHARLAGAFEREREHLASVAEVATRAFAQVTVPDLADLPFGKHAQPYTFPPLWDYRQTPTLTPQLRETFRIALRGDERKTAAIRLSKTTKARVLLEIAGEIHALGGLRLHTVMAGERDVDVPDDAYWRRALTTTPVTAAAALEFELGTDGVQNPATPPSGAYLPLHLSVSRTRWRLSVTDGYIADIPRDGAGTAQHELRRTLTDIRKAYPNATTLALTPEATASYQEFIDAAYAAAFESTGNPLIPRLLLSARPQPSVASSSFATRVAVRKRAAVTITPAKFNAAAALACYRRTLEQAALAGRKLPQARVRVTAQGDVSPALASLKACVHGDIVRFAKKTRTALTLSFELSSAR